MPQPDLDWEPVDVVRGRATSLIHLPLLCLSGRMGIGPVEVIVPGDRTHSRSSGGGGGEVESSGLGGVGIAGCGRGALYCNKTYQYPMTDNSILETASSDPLDSLLVIEIGMDDALLVVTSSFLATNG